MGTPTQQLSRSFISKYLPVMAYAIIKTGGKQYKVAVGDKVDLERLEGQSGDTTTFDQVLYYANEGDVRIGDPVLDGAKVSGKIVDQRKDKKVIAFKYKRRKGYHRTVGHRRQLTRVEISAITV
jgi:large subunit ribosomal protein L21